MAEYVLPKFDVTIDSSDHFNVKDGKIRAIIRSKYTYGKFVKGDAIVSITPISYYAWSARPNGDAIVKTIKIDGKGTIEFDILNDLEAQLDDFQQDIAYKMQAVVIEELTGRNQSATKSINVHQMRYKINAIDRDSKFEMGKPIKVNVAVTYQDNKSVMVNDATKTIVIAKVPNNQNLTETFTKFELSANGTIEARIPTYKMDESGFLLRVSLQSGESSSICIFLIVFSAASTGKISRRRSRNRLLLSKSQFRARDIANQSSNKKVKQ